MVSLHARHAHVADDRQTLSGVRVVADEVADACVMRASLIARVTQDGHQGFEIGVDVAENRKLHRVVVHKHLHAGPGTNVSNFLLLGLASCAVCVVVEEPLQCIPESLLTGAAFTPLRLSNGNRRLEFYNAFGFRTVKRPDRRRAEAALWRAAKAEGRAPGGTDNLRMHRSNYTIADAAQTVKNVETHGQVNTCNCSARLSL